MAILRHMSAPPILIDNNALVDFFVGEDSLRKAAENLRRRFPEWLAPPLCRYEFGNVLKTYVRRGMLSVADAQLMLQQAFSMVRICEECRVDVIFAEAAARNLTFYDATYTSCARRLGYQLYTRDEEILKNCPDIARAISDA